MPRRLKDAYNTPAAAVYQLLANLDLPLAGTCLECCSGEGAITRVLKEAGLEVATNDIDASQPADYHLDATQSDSWQQLPKLGWIITNPLYKKAAVMIPLAYEHARKGNIMRLRILGLEPCNNRAGWLNNALKGGFAPGRLYVVGAPPGAGKTTFCYWCADYTAAAGLPVLYTAFEMSRIQLWIYSLSRLSGINSALIESKRWNDETYQPRESLFSRVTEAARNYHTQIAPRLTILEAGPEHTPARLKGAIAQVRHSLGLDESEPVLVVLDYLQLMLSGDEKLDTAAAETQRVSRIATSLKQLARDTNTAFIAISDITKAAYQEALRTGSLDMSALRDSFKIAHAADAIALLQTGKITVGKGDNAQQQDQLQLASAKYPEKARLIEQARLKHPLNQASKDTYARLSILKNRGGMLADPLFVYKKALHSFKPIDLDLGETNDDEAI